MDVYSLNPQILPGKPAPKEQHHRRLVAAVVSAGIIVILGWIYWDLSAGQKPPTAAAPIDQEARLRNEVAAILRSSTYQPTQKEIDSVAHDLAEVKPASGAVQQSVATQLQGKN